MKRRLLTRSVRNTTSNEFSNCNNWSLVSYEGHAADRNRCRRRRADVDQLAHEIDEISGLSASRGESICASTTRSKVAAVSQFPKPCLPRDFAGLIDKADFGFCTAHEIFVILSKCQNRSSFTGRQTDPGRRPYPPGRRRWGEQSRQLMSILGDALSVYS